MTKKYCAAALTVAILAAVLAASSPAAGQWVERDFPGTWHDDYAPYSPDDDAFSPGCYYQPAYVFVIEFAAPTEAPTVGGSAEYSTDGGATWEDFPPRGTWPVASEDYTPTPRVYEGETDPRSNFNNEPAPRRTTLSESDSHPYFRGEFGLTSAIYIPDSDGGPYYYREKVRGECDGPHAGQFRLRSYEAGEFSADGGLTWVSGDLGDGTAVYDQNIKTNEDGTRYYDPDAELIGNIRLVGTIRDVIAEYIVGERLVDNGDGPEAGMHRYRYTRDPSDPQARLATYQLQAHCPDPGPYASAYYSIASRASRIGTLAVPPTCFVDVDGNNVHAGNIQAIVARRITQGCGDGRFCPSRTITRAQMAAFLHRVSSVFEEVSEPPALSDVPSDAWYRTFALWAVKNNVIRAPGGRFDPGGAVTRADMAEMLAALPRFQYRITVPDRAQGLFDDTTGLPDATVRAIEGIRAAGVTAGCATGPLRYCPDKPVTRAQMASFLARTMWPTRQ